MKNTSIYKISFGIIVVAFILMGVHWLVHPLPDMFVRIIGVVMLIDLFVFNVSSIKFRKNKK